MFDAMPQGDVHPRFNGVTPHMALPGAIHRATEADKPFMLEIARAKYDARVIDKSIAWVEWCMGNPERLVLVGANDFGIAQVDWIYGFERRGRLDLLASRPTAGAVLEALRMVRLMVGWAKEKGCQGTFKLDADTGVDFTAFAARLGGRKVEVLRCEIPL